MPELGLALVSVGGGLPPPACTVKPPVLVALCPSVLVTLTSRAPTAALPKILMLAVIFVEELKVQELPVIPAPKLHVGEARKLVPVSTTLKFEVPCVAALGLTAESVGAGELATVMTRVSGLGSVLPALSVTVKTAV